MGPVAFTTMLKPAGSTCNLDCHYCYYLDKAVQYGGRQAVMSDELLGMLHPPIHRSQPGGYRAVLLAWWRAAAAGNRDFTGKRWSSSKSMRTANGIENILQTNGTLVDEAWCDLFAGNNFLVGISARRPAGYPRLVPRNKRGQADLRAGDADDLECSSAAAWSTTR